MTRLNLILFVILIITALGTISAQHKSRKLYIELQQHEDAAKQYDVEWGQLQLEQSTWAMHARIEQIATQELHMQVPDAKRIQVLVQNASQGQKAIDMKPVASSETKQ
ncbi:MAG TPA: cell division protein FtsL [Methyloradius sp.]